MGRKGELGAEATDRCGRAMPKGSPPIARSAGMTRAAPFSAALEAVPGDGPSMAMAQRVENFQANPPAADWDGAWRLDQK